MREAVVRAALLAAAAAIGAVVANRGWSAYHDGLRPLMPDIAKGQLPRRAAARTAWKISLGFVVWYALPFSLITGIMNSLILFLGADWIGIRYPRVVTAGVIGGVWGFASSLVLTGIHHELGALPRPLPHPLLLIAVPLFYLLPIMSVVAVTSAHGAKVGLPIAAAVLVLAAALAKTAGTTVGVVSGSVMGTLFLVVLSFRTRAPMMPQPEEFQKNRAKLRRGLIPLIAIGGLVGYLASKFWIAGDPGAVMLLGLGHPVAAAVLSAFSWIGFLPLTTLTALSTAAYTTEGNPDGIPAVGYLIPVAPVAAIAGAGVMAAEVLSMGSFERLLARRPGLHAAGTSAREGMTVVLELAFLVGSVVSANAIWPGFGVLFVGAAWLMNELTGLRIPRVGVAASAAIVVGLVVNALVAAHVAPPILHV